MQTFETQGLNIAFERSGTGSPIVLLHNGGTSHAIWNEVVARLSASHETFALDLLGYGASSKPGVGYDLDHYVEILAAFVEAHRLAPVTLIGNCMGSAISLAFAKRSPQLVRALVLINPLTDATFSAGRLGSMLGFAKSAPSLSEAVYSGLAKLPLSKWIGGQALRFQTGSQGATRKVQDVAELRACYSSPGQMASLMGVLRELKHFAVLDHFVPGEGFPPICTIWGTDNRVLSAKAGRRLNQNLRPARQEWLAGCGHLPMLEQPDEVTRIIQEFLDKERRVA